MKLLTELDLKSRYERCMKHNLCFVSLKPLEDFKTVTKSDGLPLDVDFIYVNSKYIKF